MTKPQDRPLLMSGPMVRATLREIDEPGTGKTHTRRILSPANTYIDGHPWTALHKRQTWAWDKAWVDPGPSPAGNPGPYLKLPWVSGDELFRGTVKRAYPLVWPGMRLWVREAWAKVGDAPDDIHACPDLRVHAYYAADDVCAEHRKWRPSIHMPRRFSRITLSVTDVRVERLQDISEADAIAEGCGAPDTEGANAGLIKVPGSIWWTKDPRWALRGLWNSINGPGSWDANPWVAVIVFRPVLANIDALANAPEAAE